MKTAERGPFARLRWFCADGTILPPTAFACREHGGGRQHGEYTDRTQTLRDDGYLIANVLAATTPEAVLENEAAALKWILLERYLIESDDGWIFRRARYYRGAVQAESEAASAGQILQGLLGRETYRTSHFLLMREAARLLPWREGGGSLDRARALVITIAEQDPAFMPLRNKIHSWPEPADIVAVRQYMEGISEPGQRQHLQDLITALEETFVTEDLAPDLRALAGSAGLPVLLDLASQWSAAGDAESRHAIAGRVLITIREALNKLAPSQRLSALNLSMAAEEAAYAEAVALLADHAGESREWHLQRLRENLDVLYGIGFLSGREWREQSTALTEINTPLSLDDYRRSVDYIARIPAWSAGRFNFFFQRTLSKFTEIEPGVTGFIPDRMRGSPLLLYGRILETLAGDVNRLTGIRHDLFGRNVSVGLRPLNPGIARGPLQLLEHDHMAPVMNEKPVVLAPETIADLPPVAGILTAQEGNALSHIQLLARNLGIPNVVVSAGLLPEIEARIGTHVVLLSSPGGIVRLQADGPQWDEYFPTQEEKPVTIRVDLQKLNLEITDMLSLSELRADDSGRVVGPKAAKLGELKYLFPDKVSAGVAIPFGAFRKHLQQPVEPGGPSLFDWMRENYARLERIPNLELKQSETSLFLSRLRDAIRNTELDSETRRALIARMQAVFGEAGTYGVFVRSDTNVEDLPGFTGAGLNLTVPNVIGTEDIFAAVKAVWASPFTDRAFGWRQALMEDPEHVYAAVLLHQTVPAEKSGVMITADINTNAQDAFSIAVNEGVGGGVDGQAAESLMVDITTGRATLLASATEPGRRILPQAGGVRQVAASGAERVLTGGEISQLVEFGRTLPAHYPEIVDADGGIVPADVEFAFANGRLNLIQIRPFLQSTRARQNRLLNELDEQIQLNVEMEVNLNGAPRHE